MNVTDKDIVSTARQLRDEQNSALHVRPWTRRGRFRIRGWILSVPAAAIVGFVCGIWTNASMQKDAPLTALVDTVYIKVKDDQREASNQSEVPTYKRVPTSAVRKRKGLEYTGRSVAEDKIRYDLLVRN